MDTPSDGSLKGGNVVLMYHCVGTEYPNGQILTRADFVDHLEYLTNNYPVVDLPEVIEPSSTERKVALTFDAGYENFYTEIFPLLREFKLPATQFIIPERIGYKQQRNDSQLWIETFDFMDREQLWELVESDLVTLGNKSLTHVSILPSLREEGDLRAEVQGGKERLEEIFNISVDRYCYGSGRFDPKSVEVVRESHEYAVTTLDRFVDDTVDPAKIPRITADFIDLDVLKHRMTPKFIQSQWRREQFKKLIGSWNPTSDSQIRSAYEQRVGR